MQLISATPSPYARKVRIALAEKRIPFELLTEVPWNGDTCLPLHNPLEKLPVLLPGDGPPVYHSAHILDWLERRHPDPALLPRDDDGILEHRRVEVVADGICDALILCLFERMRPPAHQSEPWVARQMRKVEGGLADLARTVGSNACAAGGPVRPGGHRRRVGAGLPGRALAAGRLARTPPGAGFGYAAGLFARPSFQGTMPAVQHIRDAVV